MKRILVLRGGALGDFIVTLPALQALRNRWPDALIHFIGNARAAELGREVGLIDAVESQELGSWHSLYAGAAAPALAERLPGYDLVINFWPDPDGTLARIFPCRPEQTYLSGAPLPQSAPAAQHYLNALKPLGVAPTPLLHALRPWRPHPKRVAIHPGSGSPQKNWPETHWRRLANWLATKHGLEVNIIRGEAEASDVLFGCGAGWNNLSLSKLVDELAQCRLFLGHDSGISHLAAACGCPGVLLFGPTDPAMWAPPAPQMRVLQAGPAVDAISEMSVQGAVAAALQDRR